MKVLTAAEMREVDRRTIASGISGPILMENAGHRVVEFLAERFAPLSKERIVILCGKGNNGGDGFVIARQLFTRYPTAALHVVALQPDESEPLRMLRACGCPVHESTTSEMRTATLVIDAVLGTGVAGAAKGIALDAIREINAGFPTARVVAVDVPSGMNTDGGHSTGEIARADATVTFTAPKVCHVLPPNCDSVGEWRVGAIGSPPSLMDGVKLHLTEPADFSHLLFPRASDTNKGSFGHVLVVGGAHGKTGAAEMTGLAALRAGAGLVTVASSADRLSTLELMTSALPRTFEDLRQSAARNNVLAVGPGLGLSEEAVRLVRETAVHAEQALVLDADGLNALAGYEWRASGTRVLTPHPGEMARLAELTVADVQADRIGVARAYATEHNATLVLKGYRTVIAFADGRAWINPTGTPAMATGGTGDILTGLIAGLLAQFPDQVESAVLAAVYLHGRCGQLGAAEVGEQCLIATDLLRFLPEAMRECSRISHEL